MQEIKSIMSWTSLLLKPFNIVWPSLIFNNSLTCAITRSWYSEHWSEIAFSLPCNISFLETLYLSVMKNIFLLIKLHPLFILYLAKNCTCSLLLLYMVLNILQNRFMNCTSSDCTFNKDGSKNLCELYGNLNNLLTPLFQPVYKLFKAPDRRSQHCDP